LRLTTSSSLEPRCNSIGRGLAHGRAYGLLASSTSGPRRAITSDATLSNPRRCAWWSAIGVKLGSTHAKRPAHYVAAAQVNSRVSRGRRDRNRTRNLRFWSPGFVNVWACMRCRCMSPLGIVRGELAVRCRCLSAKLVPVGGSSRGQLILPDPPGNCSRYEIRRFSDCLLIAPSGDESFNQRFTEQRRSVPFRSPGFGTDLFPRIQALFAFSCDPLCSVPSACVAGAFAGRRKYGTMTGTRVSH
jgi:hypothetical protein